MKTTSKNEKNGRRPNFFVKKTKLKTSKKCKMTSKNEKMEDDLKKIKMEENLKKRGKKEDKPINQNQPNWL
jgi:hypothetical protein